MDFRVGKCSLLSHRAILNRVSGIGFDGPRTLHGIAFLANICNAGLWRVLLN